MSCVLILLSLLMMQLASGPTSAPAPIGADLRVSIITMGPGDASYEKFGHNMLRIQGPKQNLDVAFNWGIFDFEQKNFIWNFIQGKLWYWMVGWKTAPAIELYLRDDRTIWEQELNLSSAQKKALLNFCEWNEQDQNKFYRYDYFTDNCSTRVRDALDQALAGQIKRCASTMPSNLTFRSETLRLISSDPILYTAIDFINGQMCDRGLTVWDEMFIPMQMRDRLNQLTITDESGREIPLVKSETQLHQSKRPPMRTGPPNWVGWFLAAGLLLGSMQVWSAHSARRDSRRGLWGFAVLSIFWSLLAGFAGWLLLYGWFLTDHAAVRQNENILQLSPLLLPLVVLIPLALRRRTWAAKVCFYLSVAAVFSSALGLMLKVLPAMDQVNANMIALALPATAGLAWAMWTLNAKGTSA